MKLKPAVERRAQRGLAAVAALLVIWTVADMFIEVGSDAGPPTSETAPAQRTESQSRQAGTLEDYAVIVERPLFFDTRRPHEAPQTVKAEPAKSESAPALVLSAVILAEDRRIAIVESGRDKAQTLVPGESIEGWTLTAIEAQHATFTRGSETLTLELTVPAAAGTPDGRRREAPRPAPPEPETAPPAVETAPGSPQTGDDSPAS